MKHNLIIKAYDSRKSINHNLMVKQSDAITMNWWNELSSSRKTQLCDTNTELIGGIRRWETLNINEIQLIKNKQNSVVTLKVQRDKNFHANFRVTKN